jgi:hypothetical protein
MRLHDVPLALRELAIDEQKIQTHKRQIHQLETLKRDRCKKLGLILQAGLDPDNFPLRIQLGRGFELRVSDELMEEGEDHVQRQLQVQRHLQVCRSEHLEEPQLIRLLEGCGK